MSRKIKFRVWDKDEKRMYYDAQNTHDYNVCHAESFGEIIETPEWYEVMQYTGLNDKNGKPIYEGDIIKSDNSIGKIIYNDCEFRINWVVNKNFFNDVIPRHNKWCEVIGNIYENPNLIPDSVEVF